LSAEARVEQVGSNARTIWILTHRRVGDLRQMEHLAQTLGWRTTVKRLAFRPPNIPILARILFDRAKSDPIGPPWPDLILCAEALTSVIARLIRRQSLGKAKIVCLGRPSGNPARFDLVLTTAQYRLPKMPQVVELSLPLSAGKPENKAAPAPVEATGLAHARRPFTAVLIGGTSPPEQLDENAATVLAQTLLDHAGKTQGTLLAITSPRTGRPAADAIARLIPPPHLVHLLGAGAGNPYRQFLALADEIVVTSDSISMAAEALAAGKPVSIYKLPQRWTLAERAVEWLYRLTSGDPSSPSWLKPARWLFDSGLIEVLPDRLLFFDRLVAANLVSWPGTTSSESQKRLRKRDPHKDDLEIAVQLTRQLFAQ
jgi:mitochondrial fission protein ELM1